MTHKLCSDHCFNRYRMANGLIMNCCEHCGEYLPSKGAANNILMVDGEPKRFCCQNCVGEYKQVTLFFVCLVIKYLKFFNQFVANYHSQHYNP